MGLNDNTKNIELALNEKNKMQKEKEIKKAIEAEQKENAKRLKIDVVELIDLNFRKAINNQENLQNYYFNEKYYTLLNSIIKQCSNVKEITNMRTGKKQTIYLQQKEIKEIYEQNYFRILKQKESLVKKQQEFLKKQQEETERIKKEIQEQEEQQRIIEEQKKKEKQEKTFTILKIIFGIIASIVCLPIGFCLLLVFAACKNSK